MISGRPAKRLIESQWWLSIAADNNYARDFHTDLRDNETTAGIFTEGKMERDHGYRIRCATEQEIFKEVRGLFFPDFLV